MVMIKRIQTMYFKDKYCSVSKDVRFGFSTSTWILRCASIQNFKYCKSNIKSEIIDSFIGKSFISVSLNKKTIY